MRPEADALVWDVRMAARRIASFIDGADLAGYRSDEMMRSAVERQVEIVGEALKKLRDVDPALVERLPGVHRAIGMRNVLAHAYAVVDDEIVWIAASVHVPALVSAMHEL